MARRSAVAILPTLSALALFAAARPASAFCRTTTDEHFVASTAQPCATTGAPLAWASSGVTWAMNQDGSVQAGYADALGAAQGAFANWVAVLCPSDLATCSGAATEHPSITQSFAGPTAVHAAEYKGGGDQNVILFWDAAWPHPDGDVTLALTTVTFSTNSGEIYDADIEVNSDPSVHKLSVSDAPPPDAYDLASIFQHETGHFFGLAHTQPDDTSATMSAHYKTGEEFMRTLEADDVCGLCTIYPPGRVVNQTERGGCHCAIAGGAPSGVDVALLALAGAATVGIVRRRRRDPRQLR